MSILTSRVHDTGLVPAFRPKKEVVNCHHNYVAKEHHYGSEVFVTRKGAVRAGRGDLGIIPAFTKHGGALLYRPGERKP